MRPGAEKEHRQVLVRPCWRIYGKYYHSFDRAVEAMADNMESSIWYHSYQRSKLPGAKPQGYYNAAFITAWRKRLYRRVKAAMQKMYFASKVI